MGFDRYFDGSMDDRVDERRDVLDLLACTMAPGELAKVKHTEDVVEVVEYHGGGDYEVKYVDPLLSKIFADYSDTIVVSAVNLLPVDS